MAASADPVADVEDEFNFSAAVLRHNVKRVCSDLIAEGIEQDLSISVYFHGVEVLSMSTACVPVDRLLSPDEEVEHEEPLYMPYSITKGIVGATVLALVDKKILKLDKKVAEVWPTFARISWAWNELYTLTHAAAFVLGVLSLVWTPVGGVDVIWRLVGVVVAATLYILVPLPQSRGFVDKASLTCGDALAHRGHLQDFHTLRQFLRQIILRLCSRDGHLSAWADGRRHVESLQPSDHPGSSAFYHFVNYSWIAGGIIESSTGTTFEAAVRKFVTRPLGISSQDITMGPLPHDQEHRLRPLQPPTYRDLRGASLMRRVAGFVEARIFCAIGNSRWFRNLLLPSSNGVFTASAVARVYGAIAAGGTLCGGERVVSSRAVRHLRKRLHRSLSIDHHRKWVSRDAMGFCPWHEEGYGGQEHAVIGHRFVCCRRHTIVVWSLVRLRHFVHVSLCV